VTENIEYRKCRPFQVGILLSGSAFINLLLYKCICIVAGKPIKAMFQTLFLDKCFAKVVQSLKALRADCGRTLRCNTVGFDTSQAAIRTTCVETSSPMAGQRNPIYFMGRIFPIGKIDKMNYCWMSFVGAIIFRR
jgi:hypothetical protein